LIYDIWIDVLARKRQFDPMWRRKAARGASGRESLNWKAFLP
jgi:hypothetical protein